MWLQGTPWKTLLRSLSALLGLLATAAGLQGTTGTRDRKNHLAHPLEPGQGYFLQLSIKCLAGAPGAGKVRYRKDYTPCYLYSNAVGNAVPKPAFPVQATPPWQPMGLFSGRGSRGPCDIRPASITLSCKMGPLAKLDLCC